jgi:uncharacterized tellurite resistance protein B-like protein
MMSEFSMQHMKLALSYHMVRETIDADLQVTDAERRFLSGAFPKTSLLEAGFVDAKSATSLRYERCLGEALISIPETLSLEERLAILTQVFQASLADESFAREEGAFLVKASRLLAITTQQLNVHLDQMDAVGSVDLPAPE